MTAQELIGMVLAAGRGSRLQPLTQDIPKPAVPFMGVPMLGLAMENVRKAGATQMHVNAWHLPHRIEEALSHCSPNFGSVELHVEERLLGTSGGILNALGSSPEHSVLVHNGDVIFCGDLGPLVEAHRASDSLATLGLIRTKETSIPRSVSCSKEGVILGFGGDDRDEGWTFSGIHMLAPELFQHIVEEGCIVGDVYRKLLATGRIRGANLTGVWGDLGTIERYRSMHVEVLSEQELFHYIRPDLIGSNDSNLHHVHETAVVHDSALLRPPLVIEPGAIIESDVRVGPGSFVGANAVLTSGSLVENSVVLPNTRVEGSNINDVCFENEA